MAFGPDDAEVCQWQDAIEFAFHEVNYHRPSNSYKAVGLCVVLSSCFSSL